MAYLYADILTADGRPSKLVIPPKTTREVLITRGADAGTDPAIVYSCPGWAIKSVFVVNTRPMRDRVLLYNGGLETQWIEDQDTIAEC